MGLLQNLPEGENLPSELTELGKVIIETGKKSGKNSDKTFLMSLTLSLITL